MCTPSTIVLLVCSMRVWSLIAIPESYYTTIPKWFLFPRHEGYQDIRYPRVSWEGARTKMKDQCTTSLPSCESKGLRRYYCMANLIIVPSRTFWLHENRLIPIEVVPPHRTPSCRCIVGLPQPTVEGGTCMSLIGKLEDNISIIENYSWANGSPILKATTKMLHETNNSTWQSHKLC